MKAQNSRALWRVKSESHKFRVAAHLRAYQGSDEQPFMTEFAERQASEKEKDEKEKDWNKGYMQNIAKQGSSDIHYTPVICDAKMKDCFLKPH